MNNYKSTDEITSIDEIAKDILNLAFSLDLNKSLGIPESEWTRREFDKKLEEFEERYVLSK